MNEKVLDYDVLKIELTKYLFFTGKGGVGKTSLACATAVRLADNGYKVYLISTDPASNLQDIFERPLANEGTIIDEIPLLTVANLDPIEAASEYRESIVAPYRGILPDSAIKNMEEQLSGSCTVEIAAFNAFANFITNTDIASQYDYVIFDTAPTGHTLRMLQLPSAWSNFISNSTHGASCLGQLSGVGDKRAMYEEAVRVLADPKRTTLMLVTRPEESPLLEVSRAANELAELGVTHQILLINGVLIDADDDISQAFQNKQVRAMVQKASSLEDLDTYIIPLQAYTVSGIDSIRKLLSGETSFSNCKKEESVEFNDIHTIDAMVNDFIANQRKVIFTMGKGGVGKTTMAASIALKLVVKGFNVHVTTTDPAAHLEQVVSGTKNLTVSHIDEQAELKRYQEDVLAKAKAQGLSEDDIAYIAEDLRSPCTQEIAVFRAFAEIVERADNEIVVIDTAPTGHTLLLLDSTLSYHREVARTSGDIPKSVQNILPRLTGEETEVVIVTLPETTPVFEAKRLADDLARAHIKTKWWIVNNSFWKTKSTNHLLAYKGKNEIHWLNKVAQYAAGHIVVLPWHGASIKGDVLQKL
ncbi:arsenical pump-driving ATPase [Veillonella criceti]|uniref:Arsenical pump-driving ATPase n=1 Tax=Veillonella criceti TaxID=103891 RepID=A0A380NLP8_9FIRM|nr:arsenical pump-driving ATPase [Veillonella criceti]SUP43380.1 Arsenical pump-driving ATPase [Veillonella criceti]